MIPVADGHCDYLYGAVNRRYSFSGKRPAEQNICRDTLVAGHVKLQFFAAWTDMSSRIPPLQQCLMMTDAYHTMVESEAELAPLTKECAPDADDGIIRTVLTVEGGEAIEGSLSVLRSVYRLGVRAMSLTWNQNNELAGAALARGNRGLTELGREVIREMERIGMAVDLSHLSDRGIDEVLDMTERAPFASHSNCRAVLDAARSLTDERIRRIAKRGGTVGINFYPPQLTARGMATIKNVVDQLRHLADVGGVECCAIGSDYDGMPHYPPELKDSSCFPALVEALRSAGFTADEVERIMYRNLFDYIQQFV